MSDLYEQLLSSIDTLTPEQLAELRSILNAKQPKTEIQKIKEDIPSDEKQPCVHCGSMEKHVADRDLSVRIVVKHLIHQQVQLRVIPDLQ